MTLLFAFLAYDTCWDGKNAIDYTGTIAVTSSGIACQPWASDSPHAHTYHGATDFPYDGSDVAASNYCRDPKGTSGVNGTWCYTMNPGVKQEECTIPLCTSWYLNHIHVRVRKPRRIIFRRFSKFRL